MINAMISLAKFVRDPSIAITFKFGLALLGQLDERVIRNRHALWRRVVIESASRQGHDFVALSNGADNGPVTMEVSSFLIAVAGRSVFPGRVPSVLAKFIRRWLIQFDRRELTEEQVEAEVVVGFEARSAALGAQA
jgi:hypothetical protein